MFQRMAMPLLLFVLPALAERNLGPTWAPTNLDGVTYRWSADDLSPPACLVQLRDDQDLVTPIRISISYLDHSGFHMGLSVVFHPWDRAERLVIGCVGVGRVVVERLVEDPKKHARKVSSPVPRDSNANENGSSLARSFPAKRIVLNCLPDSHKKWIS